MIYFVCALSMEAAPLLRTFALEKRRMPYRYEIYESRAGAAVQARLTVSGIGEFHASCATAFLLGLYPPGPDDLLVNVGICGASPTLAAAVIGSVFQCGRIVSPDGRDRIYPAVRRDVPWKVAALQTSREVVKVNETTKTSGLLYDMEGYAFAKAASSFTGPERILVIKVVSDHLKEITRPDEKEVYERLRPVADILYAWELNAEKAAQAREMTPAGHLMQRARRIASDARVSVSMKDRILSRSAYISALYEAYKGDLEDKAGPEVLMGAKEAFSEAEAAIHDGRFVKTEQNRFLERLAEAATRFYDSEGTVSAAKSKVTNGKAIISIAPFSVLYIEEGIKDHPRAQKIRMQFPKADVILIRNYREIFDRSRQGLPGIPQTGAARAMILARQENIHIYPGAPMCQDHGHRKFYYASFVMNCLYDCEYCYLQGMYPSKMPVLFVNPEDVLEKIARLEDELGSKESAYVSVSFDTDLCAFEGLLGSVRMIADFAKAHPRIEIEIRTKSAGTSLAIPKFGLPLNPPENLRFAWSFSPPEVIDRVEHQTAGLQARLDGMTKAIRAGYRVRLCFDPLLHIPNGETCYARLVDRVMREAINAAESIEQTLEECVADVSVGPFRVGAQQLAKMRRVRPNSSVVMYPYEIEEHTARYKKEIEERLFTAVRDRLLQYIPEEKIFRWNA